MKAKPDQFCPQHSKTIFALAGSQSSAHQVVQNSFTNVTMPCLNSTCQLHKCWPLEGALDWS